MSARFDAVGLVVSDMAASVAFYRRLGFAFPEGAEEQGHAEAELPGGLRLLLDTEDVVRSFHAEWKPPSGGGADLAGTTVRRSGGSGHALRGTGRERLPW